jgi:DNA-directed RNA polymerase specialized sigma24 family protein
MYLKVYEASLKRKLDINDYYIIITIRNIFLDYCKENNKSVSLDLINDLECTNRTFEPTDKQLKALNSLSFLERELLTLKETMSYHEIQRKFNINYQFSRRVILEVKRKNNGKK